jgi:toxin ParE1/3/4
LTSVTAHYAIGSPGWTDLKTGSRPPGNAALTAASEGGEPIALRFIDAVEHAVGRIGRAPHLGSLRFSYELDIPELRAWQLDRFPYIVFYVAANDQIDVWRVLHTRRDIPTALSDDAE